MLQAPIPLVVLSKREDDVELINRVLRDGGHPVRCHWVIDLDRLAAAIDAHEPQLICFFADSVQAHVREIAAVKQQSKSPVPLVVVRDVVAEADMTEALLAGAQDLVSLGETDRLRSVAERELQAFQRERALRETLASANQYKEQLKAFLAGSVDPIAHVQEGIIIDANPAWCALFGAATPDALFGTPLMDAFDTASHAALKGALVACAKGQWPGDALRTAARGADGDSMTIDLSLEATFVDGERAVKLTVPRPAIAAQEREDLLDDALHKDAATGFFLRHRFIELLTDRLAHPVHGNVGALAYIRPDKFRQLEQQIGPLASEDILRQLAAELGKLAQPHDLCGRFGGQVLTIFLERGALRDIEAWTQNAVARIATTIFETGHNALSLTVTIGLAEVGPTTKEPGKLVAGAQVANRLAREQGGNRVLVQQTSDDGTVSRRCEDLWVQQIKTALVDNRFRLAHLPVASLNGKPAVMYDTLIRMINSQGDEVAAQDFLPVAARNGMLRAIDRWVIGASLAFCATTSLDRVFVKLSAESLLDKSLLDWLVKAVASSGVNPAKICFQVREEDATQYLLQTQSLAEQLTACGHGLAVENFGIGRDSVGLLAQLPLDYLKIDGSLMQSLTSNSALQERVKSFVNAANHHGIRTVAERVEDAPTMAVLFQLGVGYMQGYYVQEPEVVLSEASG